VRDAIMTEIKSNQPNFICLNFANPDMLGHTGDYNAIQKAVETVDSCLQSVVELGRTFDYEFVIIADHGNADFAINADGTPNTAHSLNPVPVVFVSNENVQLNDRILADVAPTILSRLDITQPSEMTGKSILKR